MAHPFIRPEQKTDKSVVLDEEVEVPSWLL